MSEQSNILLQLLQSLGLLSLLTLVHSVVSRRFDGQSVQPWLLSALFAVGVIAVMSAPFQVIPGFYLDGRGVVLGLAAPFGGTVAAIVTAGVAAAYRLAVGGIGAPAGVLGIVLAASAGILFRHTIQRRSGALSAKHLGLLGLLVSTYALPEGRGFSLLADLGWIILATTVGGILLIGA
ncbi:LytS/YhcK type 5TM receptor domain-containing protein, partial [Caenispirillum bisanense]|uniref:LytS/YhcK type 5TM receptor domain-containing protein n=1 Tax=Caenispirillum bisanense TaxID=414052 RepID=UPI00248259B7